MFTFLNTFQEGQAGKLKYSDQLNMSNEGKTLPKCNKCNEYKKRKNIDYCTNEY